MHWTLTVPENFSLPQLIRRSLNCERFKLLQPPFSVNRTKDHLHRVERLESGNTVYLTLSQTPAGLILHTDERLSGKDTEEVSHKTRRMLRLSENLQPFLEMARRTPGLEKTLQHGAHILRGATLFEDVIKAIILTQEEKTRQGQRITWLVDRFGDPLPSNPTRHAFPTPQQLLWGSDVLREVFPLETAQKLIRAAEKFCYEEDCLETLSNGKHSTHTLAVEMMKLLHLDPETLGLVMLNLGRYDYIPPVSCMQRHSRPSSKGNQDGMRDPYTMFEPLQPWGGLACWLWDWSSAESVEANAAGGMEWKG